VYSVKIVLINNLNTNNLALIQTPQFTNTFKLLVHR